MLRIARNIHIQISAKIIFFLKMQNLEGLQIFLIFHKKKSGGPWGQERPIVGADLIRTHDILSEPNRGTRGTSLRKLS